MAAHHDMKLAEAPFDLIKSGDKTLELRLYDEKRQLIKPGDIITFSKFPRLEEKVSAQVIGLLRYKTFEQLLADVPVSMLGHKEKDKAQLVQAMYTIYAPEDEKEYGVLGIRLKKVA